VRYWSSVIFLAAAPALAASLLTQPVTFMLGGVTYATHMPAKAVLQPPVTADRITIRDLSKSSRLERALILSLKGAAAAQFDRTAGLQGGKTLAYREQDDTGGGSGGPVAELQGVLTMGEIRLFVTCTDQSEWSRDPGWCLPILDDLKIVAPPQ
jgi:hypothetical protein